MVRTNVLSYQNECSYFKKGKEVKGMTQPSELDTLVALRFLIDLLRAEGGRTGPGEKSRPAAVKPVRR